MSNKTPSSPLEKLTKGKPFRDAMGLILGYYTGKIFGWFYCFYILAIIGGLLGADGSMGMSFFPALFFILSFAILPFCVFPFFSIIVKKIRGDDNISTEFKIILAPFIFFTCFIFYTLFSPNTVFGLLFSSIIKEFFVVIIIGFIILFFGIMTLIKFFKLKPRNKNIITYFIQDASILRKILILLSFFIIAYIFLVIFNIIINWDNIVNLLNTLS